MESYDEFARRARIMTEVHALPLTDGNDGKMSGDGPSESSSSSSSSSMSGTDGIRMQPQQAAQKKKDKDAKKSLKRL